MDDLGTYSVSIWEFRGLTVTRSICMEDCETFSSGLFHLSRRQASQSQRRESVLMNTVDDYWDMSFTRVIWCSKILETWFRKLKYLLGRLKTQACILTELLSIWAIPAPSLNEMNEDPVSASPIPRLSSVSSISLGSWLFLPWNSRQRISAIRPLKSRASTKEQRWLKVKHPK